MFSGLMHRLVVGLRTIPSGHGTRGWCVPAPNTAGLDASEDVAGFTVRPELGEESAWVSDMDCLVGKEAVVSM